MYNKLFTKILDSSIWLETMPTRIVWLTLLAVMDEDGFCAFAAVANLAHRARVEVMEAERAVAILESPDPNSSNPEHGGRRIERVPGGWVVLNAEAHRMMITREVAREQTRARVRRFRERLKGSTSVTDSNAHVTDSNVGNGSCNTSEAVSDPRSRSDRTSEDQASLCDSEGTISAPPSVSPPPLTSRHSTIHAPGAMAGALPRAHRTHVWCAFVDGRYRGVCVPDTLHAQFVGQHGGDPEDADTKLKAWYESVVRSIPVDTPIGDDVFTFWRLNFTARFGAIAPPPPTANERRRQLAEQTPLGVPARDNIP